MNCISHLPAGRSLELVASFFKEIRGDKNTNYFWYKMKSLIYNKSFTKNSLMKIDLNFFEQNHNYFNGGFIKLINDNNLKVNNLFISIIYSMVNNYANIINSSKHYCDRKVINIYGALGNNLPLFKRILKDITKHKIILKNYDIDPTLKNMQIVNKNI